IEAKVLENKKAKKVRVVKFRAKKRYLRTRGHRQKITRIKIEKIKA
ncbi:bL21 family ribosomal protein, partial [Burkholderia cepacia]|nr:bL21 family ribosomal protein [Burkholderia cepacia]